MVKKVLFEYRQKLLKGMCFYKLERNTKVKLFFIALLKAVSLTSAIAVSWFKQALKVSSDSTDVHQKRLSHMLVVRQC